MEKARIAAKLESTLSVTSSKSKKKDLSALSQNSSKTSLSKKPKRAKKSKSPPLPKVRVRTAAYEKTEAKVKELLGAERPPASFERMQANVKRDELRQKAEDLFGCKFERSIIETYNNEFIAHERAKGIAMRRDLGPYRYGPAPSNETSEGVIHCSSFLDVVWKPEEIWQEEEGDTFEAYEGEV